MTSAAVLFACSCAAGTAHAQAKAAGPPGMLEGTWKLAFAMQDGQNLGDAPDLRMTFAGNRYSIRIEGKLVRGGTFKLDATRSPMWIDVRVGMGPNKGKTRLGIVEIDGDRMRRCLPPEKQNARPASCASAGVMAEYYLRVK